MMEAGSEKRLQHDPGGLPVALLACLGGHFSPLLQAKQARQVVPGYIEPILDYRWQRLEQKAIIVEVKVSGDQS